MNTTAQGYVVKIQTAVEGKEGLSYNDSMI